MTTVEPDPGTLGFGRYPSTGMGLQHDARKPRTIILDEEPNRFFIHGNTTSNILGVNFPIPLAGVYY
jgi:hypothetical protein